MLNTDDVQKQNPTTLITGGAGFLGSHTILQLIPHYNIIAVDNLKNSSLEAIKRIEKISNSKVTFYQACVLDTNALERIFTNHPEITSVIHFAGLKSVGESWSKSIQYYLTNVTGTLNILNQMSKSKRCRGIVLSSSACVYGIASVPVTEDTEYNPQSPYARSKVQAEEVVIDACKGSSLNHDNVKLKAVILRYFNPVGAHESGLIGEDPRGVPQNLMPYMSQVAVGRFPVLNIYGSDFDTIDGTGCRDYIHVVDLAEGHLHALKKLSKMEGGDIVIYNLGSGTSTSVFQMQQMMEKVSKKKINWKLCPRRDGDVDDMYADISKAKKELGWVPTRTLQETCFDLWKWQTLNPTGYEKE